MNTNEHFISKVKQYLVIILHFEPLRFMIIGDWGFNRERLKRETARVVLFNADKYTFYF